MPYMRLNGVDITQYIDQSGLSLSENDLDAPNSGRTLDGKMHRGKVTSKVRADIKLKPVFAETLNLILPIIRSQYFKCETDFFPGKEGVEMEMYNSTRKYGVNRVNTDGKSQYEGVSFNIIER